MFGTNVQITVDHPTDRPNFTEVRVGPIVLYFSYSTIVAFRAPGFGWSGMVVSENVWSQTTGKHLNWIDGGNKADRLDSATFQRQLDLLLDRLTVTYEELVQ